MAAFDPETASTMASTPLTYRDAGVDIDAGDELVDRIKPAVRRSIGFLHVSRPRRPASPDVVPAPALDLPVVARRSVVVMFVSMMALGHDAFLAFSTRHVGAFGP